MFPESEFLTPPPSVCAEERRARRIRARDCLSAASSSGTPAGLSTAGCPQRSGGTQTVGSPFFGLPYFGEAKKGESPAAATERLRTQQSACSFNQKQIRNRAFLGSEPKFPEPAARPSGAAQRNCDPTPKTRLHAVRLDTLASSPSRTCARSYKNGSS